MGSVIVFSTKSEKAHPVNRWFAGFFVCGREAAATKRGGAKPGQSEAGAERRNRGRAKPGQSETGAERRTGAERSRGGAKPGQSERTGRSEAGAERRKTGAERKNRAERNRGRAKPGQSETGAERKNRAEEAEADAAADAAADEKTSGRDTMPGRIFRFKECSLTYQSFNQMFFHNFCEFRLE